MDVIYGVVSAAIAIGGALELDKRTPMPTVDTQVLSDPARYPSVKATPWVTGETEPLFKRIKDRGVSAVVPVSPGLPISFRYGIEIYYSGDKLLDALTADLAEELKALKPLPGRNAVLRVQVPAPESHPAVHLLTQRQKDAVGPTIVEFYKLQDEGRVEAIRKAGLFTQVTTQGDGDYVLFREGAEWFLKDRQGKRARATESAVLEEFVNAVAAAAGTLDQGGAKAAAPSGDLILPVERK